MQIVTVHNMLNPTPTATETEHTTLIDYLIEVYPKGFDSPTKIYDGGFQIPVDEYDRAFADFSGECSILHGPGAAAFVAIGFSTFWASIAAAAVAVAISAGIGYLMRPDIPESMPSPDYEEDPSSTYSLNSKQNVAKLGQVIPLIYGRVRTYPAIVEPSYTRHTGIGDNHYVYQLLCVGAGQLNIEEVLVGESPASEVGGGNFLYKIINPKYIHDIEGYIKARYDPLYRQRSRRFPGLDNVEIEEDYSDVNIASEGGYAGPFTLNTSAYGAIGASNGVEVTFTSPGLYTANAETGELEYRSIDVWVKVQAFDPGGLLLTEDESTFSITGNNRQVVTTTFAPDYTQHPHGTVYKLLFRRSSYTPRSTNVSTSDELYIGDLRFNEEGPDSSAWGDMTLIWTRARASAGLSSVSMFHINCWVSNPIHRVDSVMRHLYTDNMYGAGLPIADMDELPTTAEPFNGVIDQSITVMDALTMVAKAGSYMTYLKGSKVLIRKDEIQSFRKALYNETNIVESSIDINYTFGETIANDGVMVKYRDPDTFAQVESTYPTAALRPTQMELIGVTDEVVAAAAAKYGWLNQINRRQVITFDTDVQGVIPEYLDRIAVAHNFVRWGESGQLRSFTPYVGPSEIYLGTVTVNDPLIISATAITNGYNVTQIADAPTTGSTSVRFSISSVSSTVVLTFTASNIVGTVVYDWYYDGAAYVELDTPHTVVDGLNSITIPITSASSLVYIARSSSAIGDAHDMINISVAREEVFAELTLDRDYLLYAVGQDPVLCEDTIPCDVTPCELTELDTIVFRSPVGGISEEMNFTIIDTRTIQLTAAAPTWLYAGEDYDKTYFTLGKGDNFVKDYLLMEANPSDANVKITAINYDEEVYV